MKFIDRVIALSVVFAVLYFGDNTISHLGDSFTENVLRLVGYVVGLYLTFTGLYGVFKHQESGHIGFKLTHAVFSVGLASMALGSAV